MGHIEMMQRWTVGEEWGKHGWKLHRDRTERGHLVGVYNYHENTLNNRRLGRIPSLVCLGLR